MKLPSKPTKTSEIGTRASRDGHEFHVAWAARVALELLHPKSPLKAISLEGFPVQDAKSFSKEAMDIADLVKFYGGNTVERATRIDVLQLKYSPTKESEDLTASDLTKTLKKFVETKSDLTDRLGKKRASEVTFFEFISNRPIGENLEKAILALKSGTDAQGYIGTQAKSLKTSIGLEGAQLKDFLDRLSITGAGSSLPNLTSDVHCTLANWGGTSDPLAKGRLRDVCDLVRRKSGVAGAFNNTITCVDVIGELGIDDIEDIYPVEQSFPEVPIVLTRSFLAKLQENVLSSSRPLIIHGAGGIGKTVVMQSLANNFTNEDTVIVFDGFGGGKWRTPGDDRHLCGRSLLHIINSISSKGLCDLVLPGADEGSLLRTTHKRLKQAIKRAREVHPEANIVLLLDAIDHAGIQAKATNTHSFAHLLLEMLDHEPIEGVKIVASCRSERRKEAYQSKDYPDFRIPKFTKSEIEKLSQKRLDDITSQEISIITSRARGNPRCLDMLLLNGRPFDKSGIESTGKNGNKFLNTLIEKEFDKAIHNAKIKGTLEQSARSLISGLRLLPPPVPLEEIASAFGMEISEVESFFVDLFPLIELTPEGLIFRDEPTETLAKTLVDKDKKSTKKIIAQLTAQQSNSSYAARALPPLLVEFNHVDELVELAFSDVFPAKASSTVAVRNIRLARISAAISSCVNANRNNETFRLMMEAASAASGGERSDRYVHDFPDLATVCEDTEALRRLFEGKVSWQGARFSAHAIANLVGDSFEDAVRDSNKAIDWLNWSLHQDKQDDFQHERVSETKDWHGAIYVLLLSGQIEKVIKWLDQRDQKSAYWFFSSLLNLATRHSKISNEASLCIEEIKKMAHSGAIQELWCLTSIINNLHCSTRLEKKIIKSISCCMDEIKEDEPVYAERKKEKTLPSGLLDVAIKAIKFKLKDDAKIILSKLAIKRPSSYNFTTDHLYEDRINSWLFYSTLLAIAERRKPRLLDLVPSEIWENLSDSVKKKGSKAVESAISKLLDQNQNGKKRKKSKLRYETQREVQNAYSYRVKPLLGFANIIREIVLSSNRSIDLAKLIEHLNQELKSASDYPLRSQKRFIAGIGFNAIFQTANAVRAWTEPSSLAAVKWIKESPIEAYPWLLNTVDSFATQPTANQATLQLKNYTLSCINNDTEVEARIQSLGTLAHSIWIVSIEEAKVIFRKGLDLADALGSDNNDEMQSLVHIAAEYTGPPLLPETVHNFGRLNELTFPEETEKFIWGGYGEALARIGGVASLAIVSRLADRDKTDLEYSLPSLLTGLIKNDRLDVDLALSLIGLTGVVELWFSWEMHKFVELALPKLSKRNKELLAKWVTVEFDRVYQSSPPDSSIEKLLNTFKENSISSDALSHFEEFKTRKENNSKKDSDPTNHKFVKDKKKIRPVNFDITNVDALDNDIQKEESDDDRSIIGYWRVKEILSNETDIDKLVAFVGVIANSETLSLEGKLDSFKHINENWGSNSTAIELAIIKAVYVATNKNILELLGSDWLVGRTLRDVCELVPNEKTKLIPAFMKSLQGNLEKLSSLDWLRFASFFISAIDDDAVGNSLNRYVKLASKDIPDNFGDAPWSKDLSLPNDGEKVISGLIWQQLGSPSSKLRWRAAHSILRLAQLDRFDVIELLICKLGDEKSTPFCHAELPFYYLHARLWLAITLAKLSVDYPSKLLKFSTILKKSLKKNYDHIAISQHLIFTLTNLEKFEKRSGYKKRLQNLSILNTPLSINKIKDNFKRRDSYQGRPKGIPEPAHKVSFDYDFHKSDMDGLARLFGIDTWQVADDMSALMAGWDKSITHMYDCPRGIGRYTDFREDHKYTQGYGHYLAYHALLTIAGKNLKQYPIVESEWENNAWDDWVSEYILTSPWLSEKTDLFPTSVPTCDVDFSEANSKTSMSDRRNLAKLSNVNFQGESGENIIINGGWTGNDGVNYHISSALVERSQVKRLAYAIGSMEPSFQHLPINDHEYGWETRNIPNPAEKWVFNEEYHRERIDNTDPYGSDTVLNRSSPMSEVLSDLKLHPADTSNRIWIDSHDHVGFSSKSWGARSGSGRHAKTESGELLFGRRSIIQKYLKQKNRSLIMFVHGHKYHEKHEASGEFVNKTAIVIFSYDGKYRIVHRVPKSVQIAKTKALVHDHQSLSENFYAIQYLKF